MREDLKIFGKARDFYRTEPETGLMSVMKSWATLQIALSKEALINGTPPRDATGALAQSISFKINIEPKISLDFLMLEYWDFINSGVNGVKNQFGAPYSFETLNPSPDMVDAFVGVGGLDGWIRAKNIKELIYDKTDEEGNVTEVVKTLITDEDFRSAAYVFARGTKANGIIGNHFVDNVFNEEALEKFEIEIMKSLDHLMQ